MNKLPIDWDSVDWSLPWRAIAEQMGVNYTSVRAQAKKRGIKPSQKSSAHRSHAHPGFWYNWENVDWGMNDARIAEITGCSRYMAGRARKKMTNTYSRAGYVYFNDGTLWSEKEV